MLIESSAEMRWQRDHNTEKCGGLENGSDKSIFFLNTEIMLNYRNAKYRNKYLSKQIGYIIFKIFLFLWNLNG